MEVVTAAEQSIDEPWKATACLAKMED